MVPEILLLVIHYSSSQVILVFKNILTSSGVPRIPQIRISRKNWAGIYRNIVMLMGGPMEGQCLRRNECSSGISPPFFL